MELNILTTVVAAVILAETTYLTVRSFSPNRVARDSILIDTSVLIDGRIVSIARSGLISAKLIIPTSVVRELQFMADKADHDKRERARFGLDVIDQLKTLDGIAVDVVDDGITSQHGVDEQLIRLAQQWQAKLCTIDYNLNKSSRVQGVVVININELAHALRVTYLPGEVLDVKLQQQGQEQHQAVGYLDDGTMVVVDHAKQQIGSVVKVEATRVLQTAAGKMMFAKRVGVTSPVKAVKKDYTRGSQQPSAKPKAATPVPLRNQPKQRHEQKRTSPHRRNTSSNQEASVVDFINKK